MTALVRMKRRQFVTLLGCAAAWPFASRAEPRAVPQVGYLSSKDATAESVILASVRHGLATHGFVEGKSVEILYRWSEGDYKRLPRLAADLVARKVDVIATSGLPATLAAKEAAPRTPIVFRLAIDPVAFHLTQSFDRPGGNITGVTMLFDPLTPKKLQLLQELAPRAASFAFLINPTNPNATSHRERAEHAAKLLGLRLTILTAARRDDIDAAFAAARAADVAALLVGDDPLFDVLSRELVAAAARHHVLTMFYVRDFVLAGGLISYGPSFDEMAQQVGVYLGQILKGANPAELPVSQPTRIELVVNLKTARSLGIQIPQSVMLRADKVID